MLALIITVSVVFGGFIVYLYMDAKKDKVSFVEHSELSNPKINIPPIGYGRPHQQILEVLYSNDPYAMTRKQINMKLQKSKNHAYERQLYLWGYVNVKKIINPYGGRIHFYTLTSKGKDALVRFSNRF